MCVFSTKEPVVKVIQVGKKASRCCSLVFGSNNTSNHYTFLPLALSSLVPACMIWTIKQMSRLNGPSYHLCYMVIPLFQTKQRKQSISPQSGSDIRNGQNDITSLFSFFLADTSIKDMERSNQRLMARYTICVIWLWLFHYNF